MRIIFIGLFLMGIIITNSHAQCTGFLTCSTQQDAQSGKCADLNRGYANEIWNGHAGYNANTMTMGTSSVFSFFGSTTNTPANNIRKVISTSSVTLSNGTFKPASASYDDCFKPFLHILIGNCYESGPSTLTPLCGGRIGAQAAIVSATTVYPNPSADGYFTVKTDVSDQVNISVLNSSGQTISSSVNLQGDELKINLTGEKPGFYLIKVDKPAGSETFKVLLSK